MLTIVMAIIVYYLLFYGIILVFEGRLAPIGKKQSWAFVPGDAFLIFAIGEAAQATVGHINWAFVLLAFFIAPPAAVYLTKRDQTFYVNGKKSISLLTHGILGFGFLLFGATYHFLLFLKEMVILPTKSIILVTVGLALYVFTLVMDNYIPAFKMNETKKQAMHAQITYPIWDRRADIHIRRKK